MTVLKGARLVRTSLPTVKQSRPFSSTRARLAEVNRIFTSVRNNEDFTNALILSSASSRPLITLWTTSWCNTCRQVSPMIQQLIAHGAGGPNSDSNGICYAEIEADAPDMAEITARYPLNTVPTLMTFVSQELVDESVVRDGKKIANEKFVREWLEQEARRGPGSGMPRGLLSRLFGGGGS